MPWKQAARQHRRWRPDMAKKQGRRQDASGRSQGEARYVQIHYWMMETPAFLALSGWATKALLMVLKRYDGFNNGKISFGTRSGCFVRKPGARQLADANFGISKSSITRALAELEAYGWIVCTQEAAFDQKRLVRNWRLTWLPCDGKLPTKEFAAYSPDKCRAIAQSVSAQWKRAANSEARSIGGPTGQCTGPRTVLCYAAATPSTTM